MSTIGGVNWRRIGKILKDFFLFNVVTSNIVPVTMSHVTQTRHDNTRTLVGGPVDGESVSRLSREPE